MDEINSQFIAKNVSWVMLPQHIKNIVGNTEEYAKRIKEYSIVNQLKYKDNLIRYVEKNQRAYYEQLLRYSREHYMLFPYHLSNYIINGMRITPFQYYQSILIQMIEQEKNYDTLPNFTAADCVRLLGIGRNQYIDLMNQFKSSKKFLGMIKKPIKDLLPTKPVDTMFIDFWWTVRPGYITEDDMKQMVTASEKMLIDTILNESSETFIAGKFSFDDVLSLYVKGLIYFDILIDDNDLTYIPPLEGFVMNRITGDYFETLLYKIFVSIDEKTTISELSEVLQIDLGLVKNAISMYCRLGFAFKKNNDINLNACHASWLKRLSSSTSTELPADDAHKNISKLTENISDFINSLDYDASSIDEMERSVNTSGGDVGDIERRNSVSRQQSSADAAQHASPQSPIPGAAPCTSLPLASTSAAPMNNGGKRMGLLYDSTLAAFLMMGNLTPGLKSHAVTMFEVGKLSDESMDSFVSELAKIDEIQLEEESGEAERYFVHAIILCQTIQFLRHNLELTKNLVENSNGGDGGDCGTSVSSGLGLDLIRCESLLNLDLESCERLLCRNYELLISVAPLSNETQIITSDLIPYFGASSLVNSIWFKLYLYSITNCGPPSLLLSKGVRLTRLPNMFQHYDALMITPWGRDSGIVTISNALIAINESAIFNPVLIQAYPVNSIQMSDDDRLYLPLPLLENESPTQHRQQQQQQSQPHPDLARFSRFVCENSAIVRLLNHIDLRRVCGYLTLIKYKWLPHDRHETSPPSSTKSEVALDSSEQSYDSRTLLRQQQHWSLFDCHFGIPLFDRELNRNVCHRIRANQLFDRETLSELVQSNRRLFNEIEVFIKQFINVKNADQLVSRSNSSCGNSNSSTCKQVPLPATCVVFDGTKIKQWIA